MTINSLKTKPRVHAMIVAAGRGSRFGTSQPKQYLQIQGQTLLQHSVARLASSGYIDDCLLVIAADDNIVQTLDFLLPIHYALGGVERWQSVSEGVEAVIKKGAHELDLVLIHDAARPAVSTRDINDVIEAAMKETYGAILAAPVADTLKQSQRQISTESSLINDEKLYDSHNNDKYHDYAKCTIDRTDVWQAQTPQVFRLGQLRRVLSHIAEHKINITDEASAFEALHLPIRLVTGSRQNIKLTYPDDAILLTAILSAQQH